MDYKLLLDTAVMAGEILLESGAETWRVEDTMLRMLRMSGLKTADVLALTTGFVVTLDDPAMGTERFLPYRSRISRQIQLCPILPHCQGHLPE